MSGISRRMLTGIHLYPIKSLGGISLEVAQVTPRGLKHDRRWMLVDSKGNFMTQRKFPQMALLRPEADENGWIVRHALNPSWHQEVPFSLETGPETAVPIWKDSVLAVEASSATHEWFSDMLYESCRLMYMPDRSHRQIDPDYAAPGEVVSFADGYPLLLIGEASLEDLNTRLETPVGMDRFRPNLVFSGGSAFEEDGYSRFSIGNSTFKAVKTCARCVLTTVDQQTGKKGKEPLQTLSAYRNVEGRVIFGMNVIPLNSETVRVGESITFA